MSQFILLTPKDRVPGLMRDGYRMRQQLGGRCVALTGRVGVSVSCCIYENRPEICRVIPKDSWACRNMRADCGLGEQRTEDLEHLYG